jgi:hypothetical protein
MSTRPVRRVDSNHDMTFGSGLLNFATLAEAAAQNVRCRLLVMAGEWFLDTSVGVPWWQDPSSGVRPIMGVPRDLRYAEAVIKSVILATDGIAAINSFSSDWNAQTRKWAVTVNLSSVDGDIGDITQVFG